MKRVLSVALAILVLAGSLSATILSLPVLAEAEEKLINDCETLTGWTKTGGNALAINAGGFGSGSQAVSCNIDKGAFRTATYTAPTAIDISKYVNLEWDVMMHTGGAAGMWDEIKAQYGDEVYLKVASSATDYNVYRLSKMTVTQDTGNPLWYHFSINLSNPSSTTGSFKADKMTTFYFSTIDGAVSSAVRNGHIRIDNIYARNLKPEDPGGGDTGDDDNIILSECEDLTGWSYEGAATNMSVNANGMTGNAVHVYTGFGALRKLNFTTSADLTGQNMIEFDMFCIKEGDTAYDMWAEVTAAYSDKIGVQLSDGTNVSTYGLNKLNVTAVGSGWYRVSINVNDFTSQSGPLDLSKFTTFSIYTNTTTYLNTTVAATLYRIDNLIAMYDENATVPTGPDIGVTPGDLDGSGSMWLSDGEVTTGWSATGAAVEQDIANFTQGNASVGALGTAGVLRQLAFLPGKSLDISGYDYLEFDVYFSNMDWFNASGGMMFEMTSSGMPDQQSNRYAKGYLKDNADAFYNDAVAGGVCGKWYHIKLTIASPQTQANGGLNKTAFNFFRFYAVGAPAGTSDFSVRFDNMKFTKKDDGTGGDVTGDPSYGVVIDSENMWMSTAETLRWWEATGADVSLNSILKTQGNTSVSLTAKGGVLKQVAFTPDRALDISAYQFIEFDAYFSNLDWFNVSKGVMVELTSSGKPDVESNRYMKSALLEASPTFAADIEKGTGGGKWYHFKFSLKTPQSAARGGLNRSAFNFFRFYTVDAPTGTPDYLLCLDNLKFTKSAETSAVIKTKEYMIINDADSTAGWSASGQEVRLDKTNKKSGTASVAVTAKGGVLKELAYRPSDPLDLSGYHFLEFDLFVSDIRIFNTSTGLMVELTSSGNCDVESNRYMKSAMLAACPELAADLAAGVKGNKWYHFCFNLDRPQAQAKGGLNMKEFDFFRIYFIGSPAGTPDIEIRIDMLKATLNGNGSSVGNPGGTTTIDFGGGSGGKNVGNKINNGLLAADIAVTEPADSSVMMVIALSLGGLLILLLAGIAAVWFVMMKQTGRFSK